MNQKKGIFWVGSYGIREVVWWEQEESRDDISEATLLGTISNPQVTEADLARAITQLTEINESAEFWTQIANDPRYPAWHRLACIEALVHRHVREGLTLSELGRVLKNSKWFLDSDVRIIATLAGWVPIDCFRTFDEFGLQITTTPDLGDTTFGTIYMLVSGKPIGGELVRAIRGDEVDPRTGNLEVLDVVWYRWPPGIKRKREQDGGVAGDESAKP